MSFGAIAAVHNYALIPNCNLIGPGDPAGWIITLNNVNEETIRRLRNDKNVIWIEESKPLTTSQNVEKVKWKTKSKN